MSRKYRVLVKHSSGPAGGAVMHLIPDDAEASLCGIPRSALGQGGIFDNEVCDDCIEWLPTRMDFSDKHPRVDR